MTPLPVQQGLHRRSTDGQSPLQGRDGTAATDSTQDGCDWSWLNPENMAILRSIAVDYESSASQNTPDSKGGNPRVKVLPRGSRPLKFIGEGAANAVFEIDVPSAGRNTRGFQGLLLRVAKAPSEHQSPVYDYLKQQKHFHTAVEPLLGKYAVHQELVVLRESDIVSKLNQLLREENPERKEKFKDSYIGESNWGFLVEDMRPADPTTSILIEFKPKWLLQSPSAPKNAVRCRQCALNLQSFLEQPALCHKRLPYRKLCPLSLQPGAHELTTSPFRIAPQLSQKGEREEHQHYVECVGNVSHHEAIHLLRRQQALLDPIGPLGVSSSDPDFPLAMTLRDCTCFAHISRRGAASTGAQQPSMIKFGDLDWKDPAQKMDRWRCTEASLIDGGFYSAVAVQLGQGFYPVPTLCALEYPRRAAKTPCIRLHSSEASASDVRSRTEGDDEVYNLAVGQPDLLRPALEEWQDMVESGNVDFTVSNGAA